MMLRPLVVIDLPNLKRIESACQEVPWSEDAFQKCFEAGAFGWVIDSEFHPVGFILILLQAGEAHILNFCVLPECQHRGLGRQLMDYALNSLKEQKIKLAFLEVRRSNQRAITLYENAGFKKIGERKDYYVSMDGNEDALVFAKDLAQ